MTYVAILGRQPEFGLVELESLLGGAVQAFGRQAALTDTKLDINRLGGTVKVGRVIYRGRLGDLNEIALDLGKLPVREGKTTFGLSYYGVSASSKYVTAAGLALKKRLKGRGSVRLVAPQSGTDLSAAQVKFNGLVRSGFELLVVASGQSMVVALTEQVQDIDAYAARDHERPSRSATVGMLPPKLAQIMINTTAAPLVYDPFCGTSVVLQEALLLGRQAGGSDLSPAMVAASTANVAWLRERRPDLPAAPVQLANARDLQLPPPPLAIVSEGYLGPALRQPPTPAELRELQQESNELYATCLGHWAAQLPPGAEVSITAPVWRSAGGWRETGIVDRLPDLGYTLSSFATADSRTLVYRRPTQVVGRQLLIMRRS